MGINLIDIYHILVEQWYNKMQIHIYFSWKTTPYINGVGKSQTDPEFIVSHDE